jgi:8-amino-7-oxononanoate synthase
MATMDVLHEATIPAFPGPTGFAGERPDTNSRTAIARIVLAELGRAASGRSGRPLAVATPLAEAGIDEGRFLDAVNRLEGHYQMRFHADWLRGIRTGGDLVECIAARMFDAADRTAPTQRPAAGGSEADAFPECAALEERLAGLAAEGLANPFLLANEAVSGRLARIAGHEVVSFTSFDYLGLAGHPDVADAAKRAIDRFGTSASASRMVGGNTTLHEELDAELAAFTGTERAVVFPCGYGTNASVLGHLCGPDDLILYDELAHNSIVAGATGSKAAKRPFRHNDHERLDGLLRDLRHQYRRVVVAIEGVYSMDGDYPDLPEFLAVKRRHDALLYVDEAHSVGTMGPGGRGICDFFGVDPAEGDLWMGTISKALGSGGGYVAGPERLVRWLGCTAPSFVFSTACSPPNAAAALEAIRVIRREPWRVTRLKERAELFLKLAIDAGLDTGTSSDTPVVPVILGSSARAMRVSQRLLERGINARPILYPAVPERAARVRFFLTCEHTEEQIVRTVETLADAVAEG